MSCQSMPVIPPNRTPLLSAQYLIAAVINPAFALTGTGRSSNGCLSFEDDVDDTEVTISMDPETNQLQASPTGGRPDGANIIGWFTKSPAAGGGSAFVNMADVWSAFAGGGIPRLQILIDMWEAANPAHVGEGGGFTI